MVKKVTLVTKGQNMVAEHQYGADEKKMRELFGGGASAAASRYGVRPISVERHEYEPHMAVS
jgi:hypothetical protein